MTRIINIRATNGGGKTTLAAEYARGGTLVKVLDYYDKAGERQHPGYITAADDIVLIGQYVDGQCGGTDKIKTQNAVCDLIRAALQRAPEVILFEGLIVSGLFSRYRDLDLELTAAGHDYRWAFLRPTVDECVARVRARSARAYDGPGELEKLVGNVASKHRSVESVLCKAREAGLKVHDLPTHSLEASRAALRELVGL